MFFFSHRESKHCSLSWPSGPGQSKSCHVRLSVSAIFFVLVLLSTLVESISVPHMWFIPGFWICTNQPAVHNGEVSREIIWGLGSGAFSVLKGDSFCLFWCWCYSLHTLRVSVFPMWEICCV